MCFEPLSVFCSVDGIRFSFMKWCGMQIWFKKNRGVCHRTAKTWRSLTYRSGLIHGDEHKIILRDDLLLSNQGIQHAFHIVCMEPESNISSMCLRFIPFIYFSLLISHRREVWSHFFIGVLSLESYWSCIWVLGVSILSWLFHDFSIGGWRCSDIVVLFYFFMLLLILCFSSLDITENKKNQQVVLSAYQKLWRRIILSQDIISLLIKVHAYHSQ